MRSDWRVAAAFAEERAASLLVAYRWATTVPEGQVRSIPVDRFGESLREMTACWQKTFSQCAWECVNTEIGHAQNPGSVAIVSLPSVCLNEKGLLSPDEPPGYHGNPPFSSNRFQNRFPNSVSLSSHRSRKARSFSKCDCTTPACFGSSARSVISHGSSTTSKSWT